MTKPVTVRISGDISGLQRALDSMDARLARSTHNVDRVAKLWAGAFAVERVARGLGAVVETAGNYQSALITAGAQAELTARQQEQLGTTARKVGLEWGTGAKAATEAAGELGKAGIHFRDIGGALKASTVLAKAGGVETAQAADALAGAIQIYGKSGKDAAHVADEITSSSLSTRDSVEGVIEAFSSGASAAKQMGYSFEDTTAALTLIADKGILGAEAGTTLRSAFLHLVDPPKKAAETIEEYHLQLKDAQGHLKGTAELSDELRKKLTGPGISATETTAALKNLAGSYGFRGLAAIMSKSGDEIDHLEQRLGRQGVATEIAQKRMAGYQASVDLLKASAQEAGIVLGTPMLDGLSRGAKELTHTLGDPKTQKALQALGDDLGSRLGGAVDSLSKGLQDGTVQRGLGQVVDVADTAADTFGSFAKAGAGVLDLVSKIPSPVLQAAAAFKLWRVAAQMTVGPLMQVGVAGAAASTSLPGGRGGAALPAAGSSYIRRTAAVEPSPSLATTWRERSAAISRARDAEAAAAQAAERAAWSRSNLYTGAGGGVGNLAGAAMTRGRELEAARLRVAAQEAAAERRAAGAALRSQVLAKIPTPGLSVRGAGGAVAAGAIGTAMGGSFLEKVASGAAVGSVGGPWGIAGGAVAAAAGAGLESFLAGKAKKRIQEALSDVKAGPGKDLSTESQDRLARLKAAADKAAANNYVGDGQGNLKRKVVPDAGYTKAQRDYGTAAGRAQVDEQLRGKDLNSAAQLKAAFKEANAALEPEAKASAAKVWLRYLGELQSKGKMSKAAMQSFARSVGGNLDDALKDEVSRTAKGVDLTVALKRAAGSSRGVLAGLLKQQEDVLGGLTRAHDTSYRGIVQSAEKRMGELKRIMGDTAGASKTTREKAAAEYRKLREAVDTYVGQSAPVFDRFLQHGTTSFDQVGQSVDGLKTKIDGLVSLAPAIQGIGDAIASSPAITGGSSKKSSTKKRAGGPVRMQGGGLVDVIASPGELVVFPDGSGLTIPGERVAADTFPLAVPPGTKFLTDDMQARIAAGQSMDFAMAHGAPHFRKGGEVPRFATGGKVSGRVSWFGGPGDKSSGATTASGAPVSEPGVAIRPGSTWQSGKSTLRGYWDVHIGGHRSVLKQTDLGPNESTGRRIDVTYAAVPRFGFSTKNFPTDSTGWAAYLGKDRDAAIRRAAAGDSSGSITSPIMVGKSKLGRAPLVADAYTQAFDRASSGTSIVDTNRYKGIGVATQIREALKGITYTSKSQVSSSSSGSASGGGLPSNVTPIAGVQPGIGKLGAQLAKKFGLTVTSTTGGGHAANSWHYKGRAVDLGGSAAAMAGAAKYLEAHPSSLLEGIHKPGLSVKSGKRVPASTWGSTVWNQHGNHVHVAKRRGGVVRAFRNGGTAGTASRVIAAVKSPNSPEAYVPAIDAMLSGLAQDRLEKLRARVQAVANGAGSKFDVTRAQAALAVVDDAIGARAGAAVYRAATVISAGQANMSKLQTLQRIDGTGDTEGGYLSQQRQAQRELDQIPGARAVLQRQLGAAQRSGNKDAVDKLREQMTALNGESDELRASIAELGRSATQAAQAARESAQQQREALTAAASAWAQLSSTTKDDAQAARQAGDDHQARAWNAYLAGDDATRKSEDAAAEASRREAAYLDASDGMVEAQLAQHKAELAGDTEGAKKALQDQQQILQRELAAAQNANDAAKQDEVIQGLKSIKDAIDQASAEQAERDRALLELQTAQAEADAAKWKALAAMADAWGPDAQQISRDIAAGLGSGLPRSWTP